jgi:hypothetical protein
MPNSRFPALIAGAVAVLLVGVALGFWMSRRGTAAPPLEVEVPAEATADAGAVLRPEDKAAVELCGPATEPRAENYGPVRVETSRDADQCTLDVRTTSGEPLQDARALDQSSGIWASISAHYVDLDGDGVAELLLSGDSGGSGGFHDSWVVSQTPRPRMIEFPSVCAVGVVGAPGGGRALKTCVLGLEISGLDCNACRPKPMMFYRYAGGEFSQVNAEFITTYDESIAALARQLRADQLQAFVASKDASDPAYDANTRALVVHMAVDYVYSGRPEEARRTFEQMWPAWDRAAIVDEVIGTPAPASH